MKPLRIGIQGWGSEGDLRPLVALASRLREEGHTPRLVLTPIDGKDYGALCRSIDVPLRVVPERMGFSIETLQRDAKSNDPSKLSQAVLDRAFSPYVDDMYEAARELCGGADAIVGGSSSWPVKAAALQAGVPFAVVDYYPGVVPSRGAPPHGLSNWGPFNGVRWLALRAMFDIAFRKAPAKFFAAKGLPPIRHAIPDVLFSEWLNLHAASPALCPPAPDWPATHHVCGELYVPEDCEPWEPSPSLRAFLDDGSPPILVSFGSMEHMAPTRARELAIEAARRAQVRAIIQTKRHDMTPPFAEGRADGRNGDLYMLPWVPHRRILPRCSVFVHHGGAGTTHAGARAGKPQVVVPFIFEQKLWAKILQQHHCAEGPLSFWKATADTLAARIAAAVRSETLHRAAGELASKMAPEDGTGEAARLIAARL